MQNEECLPVPLAQQTGKMFTPLNNFVFNGARSAKYTAPPLISREVRKETKK